MAETNNTLIVSKTVKGRGRTYFLDLRESKKGNKYLQMTETSRGQNGENVRNSMILFPDRLQEFQSALNEIADQI